jgi:RimJ/RimL family protein N-acetyltransferase
MELTESRVYLRPLSVQDAEISWKWRNDPEIWKYTGSRPDKYITPEIERAWLKEVLEDPSSYRYAICIKDTNEYIGNVQITGIDCNTGEGEFHIFIGEKKYWNRGYGSEATKMMIDLARSELSLKRIVLHVNRENLPALKIYEKCGFHWDGREGQMVINLLN